MKISQIDTAAMLRVELSSLRKMQAMVNGYPRETGYLEIGEENMELSMPQVDRLLSEKIEYLLAQAEVLGVEVDE